ncbi:MAG: alpha/beta fold hydrolase [Deltaproteobacteria bacterium]|nr:alpha/beta fold hydrolase [Deltaproteobacteria bacterium]
MVAIPTLLRRPRTPLAPTPAPAAPVTPPAPAEAPGPAVFTLPAIDGVPLGARHYPPVGAPRGAVLIVGAMGVPQAFYAPLATWLAAGGHHVLTFDFRGMGASRTGPLRDVDADIVTWARLDTTAALRALQDRAGDLPLIWIGHSLGGQIVPFVPDHRELAAVITIATGSGYWRENAPALRKKVWLLWWMLAPVATPLYGYFPGKALRMVGDLPRGVIRQWRRWCLDPDYAVGAEGGAVEALFARVKTPITAVSFTDDEMMSARNTDALHASYVGAPVTHARYAPADLGVKRIGHFGFFRSAMRASWERVLTPLLPR